MLMLGADGKVKDVNNALVEMSGYLRDEVVGKNALDFVVPEQRKKTAAQIQVALINGAAPQFEVMFRSKDGSTRTLLLPPKQLVLEEAGQRSFLVMGIDITERKKAEDELRRRAQELNALQETVLEITRRHDLPTLLNSIVERAARLLGAPSGGMYLCDPERREVRCVVGYNTITNPVGTVLKYGEGAAGIVAETSEPLIIDDYRTWTGRAAVFERDQPFSAVLSVPTIWQGQVTGVIHIIDNRETRRFTQADLELLSMFANHAAVAVENARLLEQEQRHATNLEQLVLERTSKLADSEKRFRELADLLPQIVFEMDEQGSLVFVNRITFATTGYTEDDLSRGLNAFQMFAPEDHDRARQGIQRLLAGEKLGGNEYTIERKDGSTFPASVYAAPMRRGNRTVGLRGIVIDISERKRMEDSLLRSERLAAIGQTAAMVGHDLRNPLQGIAGAIHLLEQESLTAKERGEMLQLIQDNVEYSDAIVRDLSEYSAEIQLKLAETTPKSIAKDAIKAVKVPKNVTVQDLSEDHPPFRVDPDRMRRVFINLIENAIDTMPQGGTLTISSRQSNGNVEMTFSDTGSGMPDKVLENLWKPLQTTKAKGLGLGLAICKRIVDAHGGSISVKSEVGEGTTLTMQLPIIPVEVKQK
jgi:PAS domain S-box-containing protein